MIRMSDELRKLQAVDFDHPFRVGRSGAVHYDTGGSYYAPEVYHSEEADVEIGSEDWEAFSAGYTGQHGYRGPVMHASEYLGGRLADDILSTPGVYVVCAVEVHPEWRPASDDEHAEWLAGHLGADEARETEHGLEIYDREPEPAGWIVLRHKEG